MTPKGLLVAVGELIRVHRATAGLTQRALSSRAGLAYQYVSEIERGKRDIPLSTLHAIVQRGLEMNIEIAFGARTHLASALPINLSRIAAQIAELPPDQRTIAIALAEGIVQLANTGLHVRVAK